MIPNKRVTELLKEMKEDCTKDVGLRYPDEGGNGKLYGYATERYNEIVSGELDPKSKIVARVFNRLQDWYLDNAQYQILKYQDYDTAADYFARSSAYGYLLTSIGAANFECPNRHGLMLFLLDYAGYYMGQSMVCGWEKEYRQMGEWIIASINYGDQKDEEGREVYSIVSRGIDDSIPGWFLLDLYCKAYDRSYSMEHADYPENLYVYEEVLKNWNTTDEIETEKLVYMMCEYHLEMTTEAKNDAEYFSFDDSLYWLFPVEILTWLRVRERKGLKNPKTFTHPLMNTPIAKFFLSLETPLPYPTQMPYAKDLFERFKGECPNVEIPQWLQDLQTEEETSEEESDGLAGTPEHPVIRTGETAPKSGIYQAFLPNGHPDAKRVHEAPTSSRLCIEGMEMSPLGIDPDIEDEIRWAWMRE